jgi:transposase
LRQEKAVPLLAALQTWLDALAITALPKSPLGEAVTYARNQWAALNVYVTDGRLAIDNNAAERGVKNYDRLVAADFRFATVGWQNSFSAAEQQD